MDTSQDKIINRIRKLMAMTTENKATEAEAQAAMLKVQELLLSNGLSMSSVEGVSNKKTGNLSMFVGKVLEQWIPDLAALISTNTRCKMFWRRENVAGVLNSFEYHAVFIGMGEDTEIAKMTFEYALNTIKQLAKDYAKENRGSRSHNSVSRSYSIGFVQGMRIAYHDQVKKHKWELVLVCDALVEQAYEDETKGCKTIKGKMSPVHAEAYATGIQDGKEFNSQGKLAS